MLAFNKKIIIPIVAILVIIVGFGLSQYFKPHKNMNRAKAAFTISATELFSQFEKSTSESIKKYSGKVLEINGNIQTIEIKETYATIILANEGDYYGINCSFNESNLEGLDQHVVGEHITIKGECKGYIDDVIISNCVIIKKNI